MTLLRAYLTGETDPFILTKYLLDEIQKKETLRDLVAEVDESALNELEESKYKSWVETILNKPARFVSADADKYEEFILLVQIHDILTGNYVPNNNLPDESLRGNDSCTSGKCD